MRLRRPVILALFIIIFLILLSAMLLLVMRPDSTEPSGPVPVGQPGEWQLIFDEEFDGDALDGSRWAQCYWWWDPGGCTNAANDELQWYTPDNILLQDGILRLRAQEQATLGTDGQNYPYTSGLITTGPRTWSEEPVSGFDFQFGYAEVRARIPEGAGFWPTFWLLPTDLNAYPEIDILEFQGSIPTRNYMHFHYLDEAGEEMNPGESWDGPDFSRDWNTFAVDWQPDRLVWYVNGIERWRFSDQRYIPDEPMYILLNLAVGGTFPEPPGPDTVFPGYFEVDYVRVWQPAE